MGLDIDNIADAIHYPGCWDTAAYPTLESALSEVFASFRCTNEDTHHTHPADDLACEDCGLTMKDSLLLATNPSATIEQQAKRIEELEAENRTAKQWIEEAREGITIRANAKIAELSAQIALAREVLDGIGHKPGCTINAFGHECTCGLDKALSTLTTGNAVQQIEARALRTGADECRRLWKLEADAAANGTQSPKYHDAIECAAALDALAEQKERE